MSPIASDNDPIDRQCRFVSAASWCLGWLDLFALWPLEGEEQKDFRKKLLLKVSALVDEALRSEPFLELLDRIMAPSGDAWWTRSWGESEASGGREPQPNESLKEALRAIMQLVDEERKVGENREAGSKSGKAPSHEADHWNGAGVRKSSAPSAAGDEEGSDRRLVNELRETNRQLRELLALQRELLQRNGRQSGPIEESRNVAE